MSDRHFTGWRARLSLRNGLLLGAVLLLTVLWVTDGQLMRLETQRMAAEAEQRLGAYKTSLQATINRHQYLPGVLAMDPRIRDTLSRRLQERQPAAPETTAEISALLDSINTQAGSDEIFVMDRSGFTHWSSNYRSENSFVGKNYSFRPYFRDAMQGRDGFYYAVGATSGIPGLFFSSPITRDGRIQGVAVVKIDLAPLERSWQSSGDAVWVTDEKGIVFLSSNPEWHYRATSPLSQTQREELEGTRQYGTSPVTVLPRARSPVPSEALSLLLNGNPELTFPSPIEGYPWQMHWRVPQAQVVETVRWQQFGLILLYIGLTVALLFHRERRRRTDAQDAVGRLLAERESHQRAIIQNTHAGLLNLDRDYHPLFINEQARLLFGLPDAAADITPDQLIADWRRNRAGLGPVRATGIRQDGTEFPILYTLNPIRFGDQNEFILTVQDITELTRAQNALEQANEALEQRVEERTRDLHQAQDALAQSQKLAALGRMSSAIAHEINQPITALSNYVASSRLLLNHDRPEEVDQNLARIEALLERLSNLSKQLRVFSGKRNTGSDWVSAHGPVRYALDLLGPRIEKQGVECSVQLDDSRLVQANTMFLEQVVVNLLGNALDALSGRDDGRISLTLLQEEGLGLILSISDNGPGMSEDQQARVFEPFFTTKPVGEGVGLGLAISYSLARDMGADLSVESAPGEGTTFRLRFARSQPANSPQEQPTEENT